MPTLRLAHLDAAQRRAYVLADNKLALNAGWDQELLAIELQGLIAVEFDIEITGFSADRDRTRSRCRGRESANRKPRPRPRTASRRRLMTRRAAVTRPGDVWRLGRHRLVCGDARDRMVFDAADGG